MPSHAHPIDAKVYARRWKTLAVLSLSLLIIGLDNTILNVALPSLQEGLGANGSTLQWIVDSYLLVFAGLLLTFGAFGDRFGRRLALQLGVTIFGLSSLAVLFVDSSTGLIVVRSLMGVGGALIMPATLSIISNTFPREEKAKAISVWAATAAVGIGLGPLARRAPARVVLVALGLLRQRPRRRDRVSARAPARPREPRPEAGRVRLRPARCSRSSALLSLVYTIIEAPNHGWLAPVDARRLRRLAALVGAFIAWELRTAEPMLNLSYFRNPRFGVAAARDQPLQLRADGRHLRAHPVPAVRARLLEPRGRRRDDTARVRADLRCAQRRASVGPSRHDPDRHDRSRSGSRRCSSLTLLWTPSTPYWALGLWFFGYAASNGWVMAPSTASVMGAVPAEKSGVASAMNDVTRQVGGALGVAVLGSLITSLYASRRRGRHGRSLPLPPRQPRSPSAARSASPGRSRAAVPRSSTRPGAPTRAPSGSAS